MTGRIFWALLAVTTISARADLSSAARYSKESGESALLVWEDGRIVFDRQANGGRDANIFSITKTLAALGTLHAVGSGVLRLDDRVSDTVTAWKSDPLKRKITVRELLSQTSGLLPASETLYARGLRDKDAAALKTPAVAKPGTVFAYGPSHYEALEVLAARKSPPAASWLSLPLTNIRPADLRRDRRGQPYFSAGARLTARQLLELGQLVRRKGWGLILPVISPSLMREALTGSRANPMYGLGFWLNSNSRKSGAVERDVEEAIGAGLGPEGWGRSCLSRRAPADLIAMVGSRGQRVYVVPSRKQIIVRLGYEAGFRDPDFLRALYK